MLYVSQQKKIVSGKKEDPQDSRICIRNETPRHTTKKEQNSGEKKRRRRIKKRGQNETSRKNFRQRRGNDKPTNNLSHCPFFLLLHTKA